MKRVLLTCARIPSALFLARALHRSGAEVHVADSFPVHLCKRSNAVHTTHRVTSPVENKHLYKKQILEIITDYDIDLVIPVFEDGIFLSEFYDEIAQKCDIALSDFNLILQLHNKHEFIKLADKLGLPTPTTYKYDLNTNVYGLINNNKYIVKKIFSRSGRGVEIFEAGVKLSGNLQPNGEYVIQEFIDGQMICTCSYVQNGKLILHTAYKQLIVTPNGAAAVGFEAIENLKIQHSIAEFVEKICYQGWISFDIIQKPNGEFFYIECNPRLTLGICLFKPHALARTLLANNPDSHLEDAVDIGSKAQIALVSLECILRKIFKSKLQLKELKNLFSAKDLVFDRKDLLPYFYQTVCYVHVKYIAIKSKTSFLYAATMDLEWN